MQIIILTPHCDNPGPVPPWIGRPPVPGAPSLPVPQPAPTDDDQLDA